MADVTDLLARLVAIDSVNPAFGGPGEAGVAAAVERYFHEVGLETFRQPVQPGRENVVAVLPGRDRARRVVLEAHMDTVSVAGMAIPPFEPVVREGRLHGRGACDTKAGLAAMMQAVAESGELPQGREGLEVWLEQLRQQTNELSQKQQQAEAERTSWRQQLEEQRRASQLMERDLEQLTGSLNTLAARQLALQASHGDPEELTDSVQRSRQALRLQDAELSALENELLINLPAGGAMEQRLRLLDAEKDALLTSRGQNEQRCLSLSAEDPTAVVEHRQAAWEAAQADLEALERQTQALQMLQMLFHQARQDFSQRYSEPLEQAIEPYLHYLQSGRHQATLDFDPKNGFGNFELQQGQHRFGFEQLSGGMREQLAAALRLALAEVLQPAYDNCLPLIFDDAFTNSDQQRLQGLQQMLRRGVDNGLQLILLSCKPDDYQALAAELGSDIVLAAP